MMRVGIRVGSIFGACFAFALSQAVLAVHPKPASIPAEDVLLRAACSWTEIEEIFCHPAKIEIEKDNDEDELNEEFLRQLNQDQMVTWAPPADWEASANGHQL